MDIWLQHQQQYQQHQQHQQHKIKLMIIFFRLGESRRLDLAKYVAANSEVNLKKL